MKYKQKKYPCEYLKICLHRKHNRKGLEKCMNEDYKECNMAKFYDGLDNGSLFIGSKK